MSNYDNARQDLENYIFAGAPLVIMQSFERERVEKMLHEIVRDHPIDLMYYTDARQVQSISATAADTAVKEVADDPVPYMVEMFSKRQHLTFVLGDTKRLGEDGLYTRELLGAVYMAMATHNVIVIIAAEPVWIRLAKFGLVTTLDLPDIDERHEMIEHFAKHYDNVDWQASDIDRAATLLRGLSEVQIRNLLRASLVSRQRLTSDDVDRIVARKERLFSSVPNISPVNVDADIRISGLHNLKMWLDAKSKVFFASADLLDAKGIRPPKGLLLAGVPGCGKSYSARMVAHRWKLPLFRFDIGSVYDKYVGESERRMVEALQYLDNVAPCIVWIDEIEKALSTTDEGNDTGRRVLSQFLFWLQESAERVFLVATANNIAQLPPELFRKGRFSEVFFIDLPDSEEREEALEQYLGQSIDASFDDDAMSAFVQVTEGFSYSDIECAIKDIAERSLFDEEMRIDAQVLLDEFKGFVSISDSNPELIESIRAWGRERALPAS